MPSKPMIERARRGAYDELYTPLVAVEYILPYIPAGIIWESAPGTGTVVGALQRAGHEVVWKHADYFEW